MIVEEIINRKSPQYFEVEEKIFVVQQYINDRKNVSVNINLTKNFRDGNPFNKFNYLKQLEKLDSAFHDACKYYLNK